MFISLILIFVAKKRRASKRKLDKPFNITRAGCSFPRIKAINTPKGDTKLLLHLFVLSLNENKTLTPNWSISIRVNIYNLLIMNLVST